MRILAQQEQAKVQTDTDFDFDIDIFNRDPPDCLNRDAEVLSEHSFSNEIYDNGGWTDNQPVSSPVEFAKHYDWSDVANGSASQPIGEEKRLNWPDDIIYDEVPIRRCKYVNNRAKYIYRSHITTHL